MRLDEMAKSWKPELNEDQRLGYAYGTKNGKPCLIFLVDNGKRIELVLIRRDPDANGWITSTITAVDSVEAAVDRWDTLATPKRLGIERRGEFLMDRPSRP